MRLTLTEHQFFAKMDARAETCETGCGDDGRATCRQVSLIVVGVTFIEGLRDRKVDDGISQVFEAFIVATRRIRVLVQPTRMHEGLLKQALVSDAKAQSQCVRLGRSHPGSG